MSLHFKKNCIYDEHITTAEKKKFIYLIVVKKLKYKDVAKEMGSNWTQRAVQHRALQWGISNSLRGGQPFISQDELDLQKKLMSMGLTYDSITFAINKKFHTNYTRSAIATRAKTRGWRSTTNAAGLFTEYSNEELQKIKTLYELGIRKPARYKAILPNRSWSGIRRKISTMLVDKKIFDKIKVNNLIYNDILKHIKGEADGSKKINNKLARSRV